MTKRRSGRLAVVSLVFLCAAAAALTVLVYTKRTSSTGDAQLLYGGEVIATFPQSQRLESLEGGMARVTVDGYGSKVFSGLVKLVHRDESGDVIAMIRLDETPVEVTPPVACEVTIEMMERRAGPAK